MFVSAGRHELPVMIFCLVPFACDTNRMRLYLTSAIPVHSITGCLNQLAHLLILQQSTSAILMAQLKLCPTYSIC